MININVCIECGKIDEQEWKFEKRFHEWFTHHFLPSKISGIFEQVSVHIVYSKFGR